MLPTKLALWLCLPLTLGLTVASHAAPPLQDSGACGTVIPMGGGSEDINHFECTCSGAGVVLEGGVRIPGAGLSGGYSSGSSMKCTTYKVLAAYDAFSPDGEALVVPGPFVSDLLYTASCDTSDCGKFLGFLWSMGSAQCSYAGPVKIGGHTSYVVVGNCAPWEDPEVLAARGAVIADPGQ